MQLEGYALINPAVSYQITDAVEMFFRVNNLFDRDYEAISGYGIVGISAYGGLRFRFALDALISDTDTRSGKKDVRAGESNILNIGFTLPHFWKLPIVGTTALKIVKHIQDEAYPDNIRDILESFKRKRPF